MDRQTSQPLDDQSQCTVDSMEPEDKELVIKEEVDRDDEVIVAKESPKMDQVRTHVIFYDPDDKHICEGDRCCFPEVVLPRPPPLIMASESDSPSDESIDLSLTADSDTDDTSGLQIKTESLDGGDAEPMNLDSRRVDEMLDQIMAGQPPAVIVEGRRTVSQDASSLQHLLGIHIEREESIDSWDRSTVDSWDLEDIPRGPLYSHPAHPSRPEPLPMPMDVDESSVDSWDVDAVPHGPLYRSPSRSD